MAKFYVVREGRKTGIYDNWKDCEAQVKGFKGAKFKSFSSMEQAQDALQNGWESKPKKVAKDNTATQTEDYIQNSLSVDAACSGNPGAMEYQGVHTETGEPIFQSSVYPVGTNNLGEFLAIVDALRHLQHVGDSTTPIYSDSVSALAWVRNQQVKTNLPRTAETEKLWQDITSALNWLRENTYTNPILKWNTKSWGESKADYGRK